MKAWRKISFIISLVACIASSRSVSDFSHRTRFESSAWFSAARRVSREVNWGHLRKHSVNNGTRLENYKEWLFQKEHKLYFSQTEENIGVFANADLNPGDIILEFPIEQCISDKHDTDSLDGAPWEVQLAAKLLKERSRGSASKWELYINSLPKYFHLPMFYTEMKMQNVEDPYLINEIMNMRRFAMLSFDALPGAKINYAKFSDFAWALSIVYSLAYGLEGNKPLHFLFPVPGMIGSHKNAKLTTAGGILRVSIDRIVRKGNAVSLFRDESKADAFIFQGLLLGNDSNNEVKLFSDVDDVADWFFSSYGGVNTNRYLTAKISKDAIRKMIPSKSVIQPGSYAIGSNGNVDRHLLCVLASLFYAKREIELHNSNRGGIAPLDFDNEDGTTWQRVFQILAKESNRSLFSTRSDLAEEVRPAFSSAADAIVERVSALLARYTTDLLEDELLVKAAGWEGFEASGEESCSSCRWQIEKQGWNDVVATGFRASTKKQLQSFLSTFQFNSQVEAKPKATEFESDSTQELKLKRFSAWCEEHGLSLSDKIAMTLINDSSLQHNSIRGVTVSKDIEEGETLCTLALDAGLYDGTSDSLFVKDSWDLAAVRLLQEKRLGRSSKWADYIAILPRLMASPIYLHSADLEEVQWLPVLRELIQVRSAIKKSYARLQSSHFPLSSFDDYEWAVIMVHSRAFTLPVLPDDKYSHYVLMPFMDMINHHYSFQADWMSQPVIDRKLEITAKRALKKGDQLYASFGPRSNDNLFLYYGFVLENNPFDSSQIFGSFKEAVSWFIQTWTTHCKPEAIPCRNNVWQKTWSSVQQAIEDFEAGSSGQSKDWWELVSQWAEYGYQYLPYQPGPTIYASGISDPSLVAAFTEAAAILIQLPAADFDSVSSTNRTRLLLVRRYFDCLKELKSTPIDRPLLDGHHCQDLIRSALEQQQSTQSRNQLIAKVSVAVRCAELLSAFPSSIDEDRKLLEAGSSNPHVQLAREFRYRKKLQIEAVVHRLLSEEEGH